ncbi:hypothetical protein Trydic_g13322, partial [Trypoxylus dichotomus]
MSLDLEKAFDKIRYEGLLLKMKDCGFPARISKTVRTYLQNMRFHTVINSSEPCTVYDLQRRYSKTPGSPSDFKINPRKTQAIAFTRTYLERQQKITVARTEIEWSGMGMNLDIRLTFREHTKSARTRAIVTHLPHNDLHASSSWVTAAPSHIQFLVKVQNRCLRIVLHVPRIVALAALKALSEEDLEKFLKKLNKGKRRSEEAHGRLRGHKKIPRCPQQVPGRHWRMMDRRRESSQPTKSR